MNQFFSRLLFVLLVLLVMAAVFQPILSRHFAFGVEPGPVYRSFEDRDSIHRLN